MQDYRKVDLPLISNFHSSRSSRNAGNSTWTFTFSSSTSRRPIGSEKRLLIIRNLQSEKKIVNKQEEFCLSKEIFLLKRKKIPADKEIFPLQKDTFF
jgi:hypothetical protein